VVKILRCRHVVTQIFEPKLKRVERVRMIFDNKYSHGCFKGGVTVVEHRTRNNS
jgi:hypothetical protein